jgi:iron complex outermembrane receptor protein
MIESRMPKRSRASILAPCSSLAFMIAGAAVGQDTAANAAERKFDLEEVVVTARRTTENVQQVPVTVNVVSAERIEAAGISNSSEIRHLVSNLYWDDNGGGTTENRITLRGISSNASRQGFDPGVGVYVDDVYIGDTTGFNSALLDVAQVEVLKGPQGTLFGRNATAGAISIHTRRPSVDEPYAELSARAGNYDLREGRVLTNIPLSQELAASFSGIYRDRDGYQKNFSTGDRDLNDETFYGGRAKLLWTPSDSFELLWAVDYFRNDDRQNVATCFGGFACGFNPDFASIENDVAADNDSHTERTLWSTSLSATWRAQDGVELTSISAYQSREYHNDQDNDFTPVQFIRSGYHLPTDWQASEELRVATSRSARLRAVAGLYYYHEDRRIDIPQYLGTATAQLVGLPATTPPLLTTTNAQTKTDSWAAFGQLTYDITPALVGELGLRYTNDSKDFSYVQHVTSGIESWPLPIRGLFGLLDPTDTLAPGSPGVGPLSADDSWDKMTGLASLTWHATDAVNLYLRYAQGFKSGGFQSTTVASHNVAGRPFVDSNPQIPFDPEDMDSWEIGLKSELLDHRLRLNLSAFYMDYTDIQLQYTDPATRAKRVVNAGSATSKGAEIELSAAAFDGFVLDASVGWQKAELDSVSVTIPDINKGDELPYAPETTANLTASYRLEFSNGWQWVSSVTADYRSAMWLDLANTVGGAPPRPPISARSPDLTQLGARIGFETPGQWGVYVWGANLTDERAITGSITSPLPWSAQAFMLNPPRTYGVELTARF